MQMSSARMERDGGDQRIYDRLKERLLTDPPLPGKALQARLLADELGVSTTPVREALTRLAAERLLAASRHRGFFVKVPSEQEIRGLYYANKVALHAALDRWPIHVCDGNAAPHMTRSRCDAGANARATGELFLRIVARSCIDELMHIVSNIGDRLYRVRIVEFALIEGVQEELGRLAAALVQHRRDDLRAMLCAYHDRREAIAFTICEQLLIESYFPAGREADSL